MVIYDTENDVLLIGERVIFPFFSLSSQKM